MASTLRKTGMFRLPRIRTKDELFKIAQFFGETPTGEEVYSIPAGRDGPTRPRQSTPLSVTRRPGKGAESPRIFEDEGYEDDLSLMELEEVKRERNVLMQSIAAFKRSGVAAGGEAQEQDIRQLMKELELKKHKLNEMRQEARQKEIELARLMTTSTDCERLMLSDQESLLQYISRLNEEMRAVKDDLVEVEAKNRLYTLLGERTRQEHMASEQTVRCSRELRKNLRDDVYALSRTYHETCSLKEEAEKQLTKIKKMYREIQKDWQRKLKDRRKEVRMIRRSQQKECERDERRLKRKQEKEKAEMAQKSKIEEEQRAMEAKVKALAPKIQSMEATWSRLCSVSRSSSCDEIIAFWKGLKEKEEAMAALVTMKETEEAEDQRELEELEQRRVFRLEDATEPAAHLETAPEQAHDRVQEEGPEDKRNDENAALNVRLEQGLRAMVHRLVEAAPLETDAEDEAEEVIAALPVEELLKSAVERIQILSERVTESAATSERSNPSFGRFHRDTVSVENAGEAFIPKTKSYSLSLKSLSRARGKGSAIDVTKLVGYLDEEDDAARRKRAAQGDEKPTDGDTIVERSFLKARSMRFTMRNKRRET